MSGKLAHIGAQRMDVVDSDTAGSVLGDVPFLAVPEMSLDMLANGDAVDVIGKAVGFETGSAEELERGRNVWREEHRNGASSRKGGPCIGQYPILSACRSIPGQPDVSMPSAHRERDEADRHHARLRYGKMRHLSSHAARGFSGIHVLSGVDGVHTIATLNKMKARGEKIASITAYDYCSAFAASEAGVELILVGDSLGMVIHGHDSSLPVTIHDMAYHMRCVKRGNGKALLMADLPFMSYYCESKSLENAAVLMREGAQMVKLEGGAWLAESTRLLTERGIPVCAHMGLTPQSVNHLGGYRVQGRDPEKRQAIIDEALVLQDAGACIILIECVPDALGEELTRALDVPVIGIGAGSATDGQILVWHDLLGLYPGKKAKFVKNFLEGTTGGVQGALAEYVRQVKSGEFPDAEHSYT